MDARQATGGWIRKRKADSQDNNDRLSKRLSLLNLERNGQKLYVPVEAASKPEVTKRRGAASPDSDVMQLDDSKHKVYIYNIDDELSDGESSSDEGKLLFLPDIKKHLLESRIPASIRANAEGELAGRSLGNELVLYSVPSSLSVPEEQDSVRKAIIESRARTRERQRQDKETARTSRPDITPFAIGSAPSSANPLQTPEGGILGSATPEVETISDSLDDPDAMEVD